MVEEYTYYPTNLQWGYRDNIADDDPNPSSSESWKRFEDILERYEMPKRITESSARK